MCIRRTRNPAVWHGDPKKRPLSGWKRNNTITLCTLIWNPRKFALLYLRQEKVPGWNHPVLKFFTKWIFSHWFTMFLMLWFHWTSTRLFLLPAISVTWWKKVVGLHVMTLCDARKSVSLEKLQFTLGDRVSWETSIHLGWSCGLLCLCCTPGLPEEPCHSSHLAQRHPR